MKKFGFVVFTMIAALSAVGCGSSACDDYKTKVSDCCAKITDEASKKLCQAIVDGIDTSNTPAETCEAASKAYTCTVK